MKEKIIEQMNTMPHTDTRGNVYRFGEFFPPELSPFAYNESHAYEYFPLAKEEVLARGMKWREREARSYEVTLAAADLPDHINDVGEDILQAIIGCEHAGKCSHQCTGAFRIIPKELQFYRSKHLPLPRLCPNCRHEERLVHRSPLKLWRRQCNCGGVSSSNNIYKNSGTHAHGAAACPNEFETSYAPERPEIIYCESCYQSEVA